MHWLLTSVSPSSVVRPVRECAAADQLFYRSGDILVYLAIAIAGKVCVFGGTLFVS